MRKSFSTTLLFATLAVAANFAPAQTLTDVIVPQYIQGLNGTNSTRVPFAFRATLSGLTPGATYRYFNQVVISTDAATVSGAGNVIFVNQSGSFFRSSGPAMGTAGNYHEFVADLGGNFTGWFVTEPSGNARFTPGNQVYFRVMLNNGAGGTSVAARVTTTDFATVINFGATAADGTGIHSTSSPLTAKDFVLLYDNDAGTGRPIAATFVEADGSANTTANSYVLFYDSAVNEVGTAWGTIIPNTLPSGIRRMEHRSLVDGSLLNAYVDLDGAWPSTANTVNASGGATPILITNPTDYVAGVADWAILD